MQLLPVAFPSLRCQNAIKFRGNIEFVRAETANFILSNVE